MEALEGIGHFLENNDLVRFIWSLTTAYALGKDEKLAQKARDRLWKERLGMQQYLVDKSKETIDEIIARYQAKEYGQNAVERAREIKAMLDNPM